MQVVSMQAKRPALGNVKRLPQTVVGLEYIWSRGSKLIRDTGRVNGSMLHPSLRKSSRKCFLGTSIQESRKCRICHEPEGAGKWAYELWMEDEGSWMWVGWRKEEEMGVLVETRLISMAASLGVCLTHLPCLWLLYICFHLFLSYYWLERIATWMEGCVGCQIKICRLWRKHEFKKIQIETKEYFSISWTVWQTLLQLYMRGSLRTSHKRFGSWKVGVKSDSGHQFI